ncbi:IS4 family transposase, partial [Caldithrix abyssi]
IAPEEPMSLREAIRMVGQIGGHLGRKSDGEPGTVTLWRGIQRLDTATEMYIIFTSSRDGP